MNPEMVRMAQEMASKMSPEQMREMQNIASRMDPETVRKMQAQMGGMDPATFKRATEGLKPDDYVRQAQQAEQMMKSGALPNMPPAAAAASSDECAEAARLKDAGNALIKEGKHAAALAKYTASAAVLKALQLETGAARSKRSELLRACSLNSAQCYLKLERWSECIASCDDVLRGDPANFKALYRRGCALHGLGRVSESLKDLQRAAKAAEGDLPNLQLIDSKVEEVSRLKRERLARGEPVDPQENGPIVEEIVEEVEDYVRPEEGVVEEKHMPSAFRAADTGAETEAVEIAGLSPSSLEATKEPRAPRVNNAPPAAPTAPLLDNDKLQQMEAMLRQDPDHLKRTAEMMRGMKGEDLRRMLALSGMEVPPGFSDDDVKRMADSMATMTPDAYLAAAKAAAGGSDRASMEETAAALQKNPEMIKTAVQMMEGMSDEQLAEMARMQQQMTGQAVSVEQMRSVSAMMKNLNPEDLEAMTKMAEKMGAGGPEGAAAFTGDSSAAMMDRMSEVMADPGALEMAARMMKSMPAEQLHDLMSKSGMGLSLEQARQMKSMFDSVSPQTIERLMRAVTYLSTIPQKIKRAKESIMNGGLLTVALVVLLIALVLRYFNVL